MPKEFDHRGFEIPDNTPVEIPLDFSRALTMEERIMNAVQQEMSRLAEQQGFETIEESEDFDIGDEDDYPFASEYEFDEMDEEMTQEEFDALSAGAEEQAEGAADPPANPPVESSPGGEVNEA